MSAGRAASFRCLFCLCANEHFFLINFCIHPRLRNCLGRPLCVALNVAGVSHFDMGRLRGWWDARRSSGA